MTRKRKRPEGAPSLTEKYTDWRDFTNRVARPWVESDADDPDVDWWYHGLMLVPDPYYLACALVVADNRIHALEAALNEKEPSDGG